MHTESIEKALTDLNKLSMPSPVNFPIDFTSKLSSALNRCLEAEAKPFPARAGEPIEIIFNEPAFLCSVEITFSDKVIGAQFHLNVFDPLNNKNIKSKLEEDTNSEKLVFNVDLIASGFSIFLKPTYFEIFRRKTLEVKHVKIVGYNEKDFIDLDRSLEKVRWIRSSAIKEISDNKDFLSKKEQELDSREEILDELEATKKEELESLEEKISESEKTNSELEKNIKQLKDEISRAETQRAITLQEVAAKESTLREVEYEIQRGKETIKSNTTSINELSRKLKELTGNVNMFSEEFLSFSDHGAKQAKLFIALSLIPLLMIAGLTGQLLSGAVDLSVKYNEDPNIDLLTIFVTRLPYLAICGSILAVSYSIVKFLFNRISFIYAERLDFAKIGILAKDVVTASTHDLNLTDEELSEARTYLKIEILKSYLSGNIGILTYNKRDKNRKEKYLESKDEQSTNTSQEEDEDGAENN